MFTAVNDGIESKVDLRQAVTGVCYVPARDISHSLAVTKAPELWHIAMPVEEPSKASQADFLPCDDMIPLYASNV
jgi:hypothetical protein